MNLSTKTGRILLGAAISVLCLSLLLCGFLFLNRDQGEPSLEQNGSQQTTVTPTPDDDDVITNDDPIVPGPVTPTQPEETQPEETQPEQTQPAKPSKPSTDSGKIQIMGQVTSENNVVTQDATFSGGGISAQVSAGTQLEANTSKLVLTITEKKSSDSGVALEKGQSMLPLDVHISGISKDNTAPVVVNLGKVLVNGMNIGNVTLYHVENGVANPMTQVFSTDALTAHNQFYYDPATGDTSVAMASFSEVTLVSEDAKPWNGEADFNWYKADVKELTIANADQLWAFSQIVGGMAEGIQQDTFRGKTVKLLADINLNDAESGNTDNIFYPIGYYNSTGSYNKVSGGSVSSSVSSFEGTFDGNGHVIANFYQNTWEMFGDYNSGYSGTPNHYKDAMGLFGYVVGGDHKGEDNYVATIKNLTIENFSSDGEFTPTGVIAAYAKGNVVFENIALVNCNPRVYNTGNGGIVGWDDGGDAENDPNENTHYTFKNITIDNTNKISALWGSWDVACGGLMGYKAPYTEVNMENCHVAAQIDVFNDVCGNYQYYWYRYAGMLIGTIDRHTTDSNGYTVPDTTGITAKDCTVHFGEWNDYFYCELVANSLASYTHDHQFSRLTEVKSVEGNTITYLDGTTGTVPVSGRYNYVVVNGTPSTENATCHHFVNGQVWNHADAGFETFDLDGNGKLDDLKEDRQHVYLPFNQLFTGYGWGVKNIPIYNNGDNAFDGVTILNETSADSVKKFDGSQVSANTEYLSGKTVKVGELFSEIANHRYKLDETNVQVFVSPAPSDPSSTAGCVYKPNTTNWADGTITFIGTGKASITITDYYYCTPTVITVNITPHTCSAHPEYNKQWQPWVDSLVYTGHTANSMDGYVNGVKDESQAYNANVINDGFYYLAEDVTLDRIIDQRLAADITICLNGHTLTGVNIEGNGDGLRGRIFRLVNGSKVTICDCAGGGTLAAGDDHTTGTVAYLRSTSEANAVSFTMEGGIMDGNGKSASQNGGLIYAEGYATVDLKNATLKKGIASNDGGAIYVNKGAQLKLENTAIRNCTAGGTGGAIRSNNANVSISGGTIDTCSATGSGGAICLFGAGTNSIADNASITNCSTGKNGGAIYINTTALTIDNATISSNNATGKGGAIFLSGNEATLTMNDGTISGNTTTEDAPISVSQTCSFTMNDGTITGNTTQANITGVNVVGTFIMNGGQIYGNSGGQNEAWSEVGATNAESKITINGGTITAHESGKWALRAYKGQVNIQNGTVGIVRFDAGEVTMNGGHVASISDANQEAQATTKGGSMSVTGGSFDNETAKDYLAVGLYLKHENDIYTVTSCGDSHVFEDDKVLCTNGCQTVNPAYNSNTALTQIKINGNTYDLEEDQTEHEIEVGSSTSIYVEAFPKNPNATATVDNSENGYVTIGDGKTFTFTVTVTPVEGDPKTHTFTGSRSDHTTTCTVCQDNNITWNELDNNDFTTYTGGYKLAAGYYYLNSEFTLPGQLYVNGVDVTICLNGHKLTGPSGARMFRVAESGSLTILDCGNSGKLEPKYSFNGALAYVNKATFTMIGCTVDISSGVVASSYGGAIWAESGATLTMNGTTIQGASSTGYAGAIRAKATTLTLDGVTFRNCQAGTNGGAIYLESITNAPTIVNCAFENCSAQLGGAVYMNGLTVPVSIQNCSFENCSATTSDTNGRGGALWISSTQAAVSNCSFVGCWANKYGGAIMHSGNKDLTVSNSSFIGNAESYPESGGAIYSNSTAKLTIQNGCSFEQCKASTTGGALYRYNGPVDISDAKYTGCSTGENGGAIYTSGGSKEAGRVIITLDNVTMTENEAKRGGAIYGSDYSTYTIHNCTIKENITSSSYAAVLFNGSTNYVTVSGKTQIINNQNTSGQGMFDTVGKGLQFHGSTSILTLAELTKDAELVLWWSDNESSQITDTSTRPATSMFAVNGGLEPGKIIVYGGLGVNVSNTATRGSLYLSNGTPAFCSHEFGPWTYVDDVNHTHSCACGFNTKTEPHTEGKAVKENDVPATCTENGSYDSVIYCSECGGELSRKSVTVEAGHTFEEGICTVCGEPEPNDGGEGSGEVTPEGGDVNDGGSTGGESGESGSETETTEPTA